MKIKEFAEKWMGKVARSPVQMKRVMRDDPEHHWPLAWTRVEEPVVGWVIGIRTVHDGHTVPGAWEGGSVWCPHTGTGQSVALITTSPDKKPILVPVERLEETDLPPDGKVNAWRESDKKEMQEIMRDHPRDEKGRWLPASAK